MENTDFKNIRTTEYKDIKGWGVDADAKNDPTYPMKKRTNEEHNGYSWERPPLQPVNVEILRSVERPNITSVFGTSTPPSGVSGMIRRYAFKYSESSYGRWHPLVLADRVNVVEGLIDDLKRGHIPNVFAERGWTAEWKYNRQEFIRNAVTGVLVAAAVIAMISLSSKKRVKS